MYIKSFGFKESPFNPGPDPRFVYLSRSHREALASMIYGIEERRGFVAIIGEVGSGKTTLIHSLFKSLDDKTDTAFVFYPIGSYSDLLRNILLEFNIDGKGQDNFDMRMKFRDFVIDQFQKGKNVAIIFDEAQNMSPEVLEQLRLLSNLEAPEKKLLQIVLVGQPELSNKLKQPELRQLRQRIGIRREIEPLNEPEIRSYIQHRLKVAGYEDRLKLFSDRALDLISRHSKGIPRVVNILCDNCLLIAYGLGQRKIDESIVQEVLADLRIGESVEERTSTGQYPIYNYATSKPLNRRLWIRAALLPAVLLLMFLIQGDGGIGVIRRYISEAGPVSTKMGMFLSNSNERVGQKIQVPVIPAEEGPPGALERLPSGKKLEEKKDKEVIPRPVAKKPDGNSVRPYPWAVQLSSYQSLMPAQELKKELKLRGFPAYLIVGNDDGDTWYGVRVGLYDTQEEALEIGEEIASEFCYINDYFATQPPIRNYRQKD